MRGCWNGSTCLRDAWWLSGLMRRQYDGAHAVISLTSIMFCHIEDNCILTCLMTVNYWSFSNWRLFWKCPMEAHEFQASSFCTAPWSKRWWMPFTMSQVFGSVGQRIFRQIKTSLGIRCPDGQFKFPHPSMRQLPPSCRLRWRKMAAITGKTLIAQRCTVEWYTKTQHSCIISSVWRRLNG